MATIAVTPTSAARGAKVNVSGTGYGWREQITVTFDGVTVVKVKATVTGALVTSFTVPLSATAGVHAVRAKTRYTSVQTSLTVVVAVSPPVDPLPVISGIVVSNVTTTGFTLDWVVSEVAQGWVEYATNSAFTGSADTAHETSLNYSAHRQVLTGLTTGTLYYYRIHAIDSAAQSVLSATRTQTTIGTPVTPPPPIYTLEDNFDGVAINPRWRSLAGPNDPGDRLDTDIMGDLRQVSVAGGICTITCERKATPSGRPFAGAMMSTWGQSPSNTWSQKYGTWEARIRYDEAKGTWPSWFLLPEGQYGPYPEIDVFESYADAACMGVGYSVHALHYAGEIVSDYKVIPLADSEGWHVWKIVWTATKFEFWVDGVMTYSITNVAHIPQVPMYPLFIYGVGANNAACRADGTTPDVLTMQIDYLRVKAV